MKVLMFIAYYDRLPASLARMNDVIRFSRATEDEVTFEIIPFRNGQSDADDRIHFSGINRDSSRLSRLIHSIYQTIKLRDAVDVVQFTSFPSYMLLHLSILVDKPIVFGPSLAPSIMRPVDDMDETFRRHLDRYDPHRLLKMKLYGEHVVRTRLWLAKRLPRSPIHFVGFSRFQADNALIPRGVPEDNLSILPSGVPRDVFYPEHGPHNRSELLAYCPTDPIGANHKGVDTLAKAIRHVDRSIQVRIIGADAPPEGLEPLFEPIDDQVSFEGRIMRRKLPHYYRRADAFVLPSIIEVENTMKIEALACGTPCIVTDGHGFRENVVGDSVVYFDRADPVSLARAIEQFYENIGHYQSEAYAHSDEYDIAATYEKLRTIYRDLHNA